MNATQIQTSGATYTVKDQQAGLINGFGYIENCYIREDGTIRTSAPGRYVTDFIPCSPGIYVKYIAETNHSGICGIAFYDINKQFISGYKNNGTKGTEITVLSPANTAYCRSSTDDATLNSSYVHLQSGGISKTIDKASQKTCFIGPSGSDEDGDGSYSNPFATVNKCLSEGAAKIMVKQGVYSQQINLSYKQHNRITIAAADTTGRSVFVHPDSLLSNSETKANIYTKLYYFPFSGSLRSDIRLYQDGVPDASTLISDAERNPYQRGQAYRCLDTKIIPCTNTGRTEALLEIEESTEYKWYHDTNAGIMYFSRPQAVSAEHPIMVSVHSANFINNTSRDTELYMYGIECKYMRFYVGGMIAHLEDCKSANCFGAGGFVYDSGLSTEFVRCESSGTYYAGGAGDGFNGHASSTGDIYSKQCTTRLVDCWSHDSMDDGYSDHERAEIEVWGGLFEYNGKAGVTPSYGSHCSCYNVISRKNYSGFRYLGVVTQEEGGKYGQMLCIGCIAENNIDEESGYGFGVNSQGNLAKLIGCKSIGNTIGYYCADQTILELIDCGALNNETEKVFNGTVYVNNTSIVTAT